MFLVEMTSGGKWLSGKNVSSPAELWRGEGPHLTSISGTAKVKAEKADWTMVHRKDDYSTKHW